MKNKKIIITLSIITILILSIGVTFAVFNYNKVGTKNSSLVVGDIYMHYNETNELTIENAMPFDGTRYLHNKNITEEEVNKCVTHLTSLWGEEKVGVTVLEGESYKNFCNGTGTRGNNTFQDYLNESNFLTDSLNYFETNNIIKMSYKSLPYFEFTVDGKNTTSDKNIYYEIKTSYGDIVNGKTTRIKDELLKFTLVEYNNVVEKRILTDYSFVDLNNQTIWANSIDSNTNEEIKRTYRLYMWVSNDTKICSGEMTENCDYYTSQTPNWSDVFASIKINVSGDFTEKKVNYNILTNDLLSGIDVTKDKISEINFLKLNNDEINTKYQAATYKKSGINPLYAGDGIKIWLENDATDTTKFIMNIASNDTIYFPSDSSMLFFNYASLKSINFSNVDTSDVKNMYCMFNRCTALTSLDLSKFDTKNVENMSAMFLACEALTSLNLSNFDTSKVTNFMNMFINCFRLTNLDVSNFNTSSANNMHGMFWGCSGLTSLDVSNFNTSNVKNMEALFYECSSLTSLDVSNFNTSNVENMNLMFGWCSKLTNLDVSNFNTSKVIDMGRMFSGLGLNTNVPFNIVGLEKFDTSNVTSMTGMFSSNVASGSGKLTNETLAGISNWNVSKVTYFNEMFYGQGTYLTTLDLSKWDTSSATSFNRMFKYCVNLDVVYVGSNWSTANANTTDMFSGAKISEVTKKA